MTLPRVSICGWCGRALGLESDRRLPPGEHVGKIRVTKEMCPHCAKRFSDGIGAKDVVTYPDAKKLYKEEKKEDSK